MKMRTGAAPNMTQINPNFSGTWRLNLEKSKVRSQVTGEMLVTIEHTEPRLVQRVLVIQSGGSESKADFEYETGGETANTTAMGALRTRAEWDGPELVIESWLKSKDREYHFRDHWSLSGDGDTLTMAHRDDDLAGQVSVLERVSPEAAARFTTQR